jgi:hypothetical protein
MMNYFKASSILIFLIHKCFVLTIHDKYLLKSLLANVLKRNYIVTIDEFSNNKGL